MAKPEGFSSLKEFIDSVRSQKFSTFLARNLPGTKVANESAFADMQAHILKLYENTEALHSFVDETGAVYDCIPAEQQPSLRGSRGRIPSAPDAPAPKHEAARSSYDERSDSLSGSPLGLDKKDRFGNVMHCPEGTIPMRRVTLEQVTRFETLRDFFQKGPGGAGRPSQMIELAVESSHRHAIGYQFVSNFGGHSFLNVWAPFVNTDRCQIFSLSQQWYIGGTGDNTQTVECGWEVYPRYYGDDSPHLFTFWTADNYNRAKCRNLDCGAFVQVPGAPIAPGMPLWPVSVIDGTQYRIELTYWHSLGNWWLYFNGQSGTNLIGYYPDTLFGDGPLSGNASRIDYGGETVGTVSFPPMGSGLFAHEGWRRAAYQRNIGYYAPGGTPFVDASLTAFMSTPSWYTATELLNTEPTWRETWWVGGPGGDLPDAFVIVPDVRYKPRGEAAALVVDSGLVPEFSGSDAQDARVFIQRPLPGGRVKRGSTVWMFMRDVPPP
jgi:hypothetical protein